MDKSQIELEKKLKKRGRDLFFQIADKFYNYKEFGYIIKSFAFIYSDYINQYGVGLSDEQKDNFYKLKVKLLESSVDISNSITINRDISEKIQKAKKLFL